MKPIPLWRRYARFFGPDPVADVKDELRFHLDTKTDDLIAQGWTPEAARREAERQFGDMKAVQRAGEKIGEKMESRRRLADHWNDCVRDVRYTFRKLRREPGFAAVSILILALAIGANVAVFSVVNTLLLRPLPFPDSRELVWIAPPPQNCGWSCATYSADAFEELRAQSRAYQDITGYEAFTTPDNVRLTGRGEPVPATCIEVIGNFFQVLGVRPAMGRIFTEEEVRGGLHPVTILANPYWRRQFNADPNIVGKAIELNGTPVTVVGVLPDSFDFGAVFSPGERADLYTPVDLNMERDWGNIVTLLGRLKPGVTIVKRLPITNALPRICISTRSIRKRSGATKVSLSQSC